MKIQRIEAQDIKSFVVILGRITKLNLRCDDEPTINVLSDGGHVPVSLIGRGGVVRFLGYFKFYRAIDGAIRFYINPTLWLGGTNLCRLLTIEGHGLARSVTRHLINIPSANNQYALFKANRSYTT